MRIGTKLLLTFAVFIGVVALAAGVLLPRWVRASVAIAEHRRLEQQAQRFAGDLAARIRNRRLLALPAQLAFVETLLVDDTLALVDAQGRVRVASSAEFQALPPVDLQSLCAPPANRLLASPLYSLPGVGQVVCARAPIESEEARGLSVLMMRDVKYIDRIATPIVRRLFGVTVAVLLTAALAILGIAREMVRRLQQTGRAAQSLAEGKLGKRAPVTGSDEITDLANHFNHMADRLEALVAGLRRSEQLRKDLLVTVSHELRTPMTSIAGFAEALRDGVVRDESQRERYYQIITSEAQRLNRLINDVFAVARLEAGQVEIRLQAMDLLPWLEEVTESTTPLAEGAGCRIELQAGPAVTSLKVYADRDRLDQIISNLLANAFRFSPEGEAVTIRAAVDGGDAVISVTDLGPGMAPEEADKAFERFFQGSSRGRGHHGAGLGLAIVKSLVEAHGGKVGVTTAPGAGATFWFRLKRI